MPEICPEEFKVEYQFFGKNELNKIEFIDNKLIFTNEYGIYVREVCKEEIKTTKEEWIEFWQKIDGICAWNWNKEYKFESSQICADTAKIKIRYGDKNIDTSCVCNAPKGIEEFFEALKELIKLDIRDPNAIQ